MGQMNRRELCGAGENCAQSFVDGISLFSADGIFSLSHGLLVLYMDVCARCVVSDVFMF